MLIISTVQIGQGAEPAVDVHLAGQWGIPTGMGGGEGSKPCSYLLGRGEYLVEVLYLLGRQGSCRWRSHAHDSSLHMCWNPDIQVVELSHSPPLPSPRRVETELRQDDVETEMLSAAATAILSCSSQPRTTAQQCLYRLDRLPAAQYSWHTSHTYTVCKHFTITGHVV